MILALTGEAHTVKFFVPTVLHLLLASLALIKIRCEPLDTPVRFAIIAKLLNVVLGVKLTAVPKPKPGSVSIKYSMLVILLNATATGTISLKNGRTTTVLQRLALSLALTESQCKPSLVAVSGATNVKSLVVVAAVNVTAEPLPKPGSLSMKYSIAVTTPKGVDAPKIRSLKNGRTTTVLHLFTSSFARTLTK